MTTSSYLPSFKDAKEGRSPGLGISIGSDRVTFSWFEDRKDLESSSPLNFLTTWPRDETSSRRDSSWGERSIVEDWFLFWYIFLLFSKKISYNSFAGLIFGTFVTKLIKESFGGGTKSLPKVKEGSSRNRYIYIYSGKGTARSWSWQKRRERTTDRQRMKQSWGRALRQYQRKKDRNIAELSTRENILSHFGFTSFICLSKESLFIQR